jgi:hypothetical protein
VFGQEKCRHEQQNPCDGAGNDRCRATSLDVTNNASGDREQAKNNEINLRRFHLGMRQHW